MNPTERLTQIKDQIDGAKTRQAEIKGKISSVREQMQTGFKVKDLPAAEKKLETMGIDLDKMETQFNEGMESLEKEMEKARKENQEVFDLLLHGSKNEMNIQDIRRYGNARNCL